MSSSGRLRAERIEVRRSRAAILDAAEQHWAKRETDPTMAELAKLAGVGSATLYRRFPNIDAVADELHAALIGELQKVADLVTAQTTGWDGIVALVTGIISVLQEHPALSRLNRRMVGRGSETHIGTSWEGPLEELLAQAKREGALRADVNPNDVTFASFRIGSYSNLPPAEADRIIGRQVGIVLDGLRAGNHVSELPGSPVSMSDLLDIFRHEATHPVD